MSRLEMSIDVGLIEYIYQSYCQKGSNQFHAVKSIIQSNHDQFTISLDIMLQKLQDTAFLLKNLPYHAGLYQYLPDEYKDDLTFNLHVIPIHPHLIKQTSERLRRNDLLQIYALMKSKNELFFKEIFEGKLEYLADKLRVAPYLGKYIPRNILKNKDLMIEMIKYCPSLLGYLTDDYRDHAPLIKRLLKHDGTQLQFVSDRLRADYQVVSIAIRQNPMSIEFASSALKKDRALIKLALKSDLSEYDQPFLQCIDPSFQDDEEIVYEVCRNQGYEQFDHASNRLKNDYDFAKKAMKLDPWIYQFLDDQLANDPRIALYAFKLEPKIALILSDEMQELTPIRRFLKRLKKNDYRF
jgi:hypothetical protein